MPRRFSDAFGVSSESLRKEGAFDGFVDIDSKFHVDPHLLASSSAPELTNSYETFRSYFQDIVQILKTAREPNGRLFRAAQDRLMFREIPFTSLGYGRNQRSIGKGIGAVLARKILNVACELIEAGIEVLHYKGAVAAQYLYDDFHMRNLGTSIFCFLRLAPRNCWLCLPASATRPLLECRVSTTI